MMDQEVFLFAQKIILFIKIKVIKKLELLFLEEKEQIQNNLF